MLADLVRDGVLDAELAGLVWLLARGPDPGPRRRPGRRRPRPRAGRRRRGPAAGRPPGDRRARTTTSSGCARPWSWGGGASGWGSGRSRGTPSPPPTACWWRGDSGHADGIAGERARIVVRALTLGYGLLATTGGAGLDDVIATLGDPAVGTDEDERSRLGVVLVLAERRRVQGRAPRTTSAPSRSIPTATSSACRPRCSRRGTRATERWDHFAWGLMAELGARTGRTSLELEREQARRAPALAEAPRPRRLTGQAHRATLRSWP